MSSNSTKPKYIRLIYTYKEDLALNNLQWLICYIKQIKPNRKNVNNKINKLRSYQSNEDYFIINKEKNNMQKIHKSVRNAQLERLNPRCSSPTSCFVEIVIRKGKVT